MRRRLAERLLGATSQYTALEHKRDRERLANAMMDAQQRHARELKRERELLATVMDAAASYMSHRERGLIALEARSLIAAQGHQDMDALSRALATWAIEGTWEWPPS